MLYCSSVWSNTTAQNINKIQSIQNFACKIITNSKKFDHVSPLLRHLNWLPVREQLHYRDSILAFKCINGTAPQYLTSKFKRRSKIHTRNTRNANTSQLPLLSRLHTSKFSLTSVIDNVHMLMCMNDKFSCLLYTSPSPRDLSTSRMPSSA